METKQCRTCGNVLDVSKFSIIKTSSTGKKFYRPDCKTCMRGKYSKSKKEKTEILNTDIETADTGNNTVANIETVKPDTKPVIPTPINNKKPSDVKVKKIVRPEDLLNIVTSRSNRIISNFNFDIDVKKNVMTFAKEHKINLSDAINYILSEYFK